MAEAIKKRSFNIPEPLYKRLERIAAKEDRTVNAQVVRWLEKNVSEYEKAESKEIDLGNPKPAPLRPVQYA